MWKGRWDPFAGMGGWSGAQIYFILASANKRGEGIRRKKEKDFQTTENISTWESSEPKYVEGIKRQNVDSNPQKRLFPSAFPPQSDDAAWKGTLKIKPTVQSQCYGWRGKKKKVISSSQTIRGLAGVHWWHSCAQQRWGGWGERADTEQRWGSENDRSSADFNHRVELLMFSFFWGVLSIKRDDFVCTAPAPLLSARCNRTVSVCNSFML